MRGAREREILVPSGKKDEKTREKGKREGLRLVEEKDWVGVEGGKKRGIRKP